MSNAHTSCNNYVLHIFLLFVACTYVHAVRLFVVARVARIMSAKSPVKAKVMNAYFVKLVCVRLNELIEGVYAVEFGIYE